MNKLNASGYKDLTAYEAVRNIDKSKVDGKADSIIRVIKDVMRIAGFELIGRIPIRHIKSGREYR